MEAWNDKQQTQLLQRQRKHQQSADVPIKARSIFFHGLPEMGPISEATHFTSNPSIPTEEQHAEAWLKILPFSVLPDLEQNNLPDPDTNIIWSQVVKKKGNLGGFSSEADVNSFVKAVLLDVLNALDVREEVTIRMEVEVMRNRPEFMVIVVDGHPIGTVEGKQPGEEAMHHGNILGEVYDQLQHLRSVFRVDVPFAVLTSYNEWRICWLDDDESNERASSAEIPQHDSYRTPSKTKRDANSEDSPPTPELPATPSRMIPVGTIQAADDSSDAVATVGNDDKLRTLCGTRVVEWDEMELPLLLASVIKKMMLARQGTSPLVLRLANEETSAWKKAPEWKSLNFSLCISTRVKNYFIWEDLGRGADGRAFLVSGGTKGAVGVLKFFFKDAETQAQKEESRWKSVYSHLPAVAHSLRVTRVMGHTTLLMPWFQTPRRTQATLDAVAKTLREDFMANGFRHGDVAWRNVGVYREDGEMRAVVFDMQKVDPCEANTDWVTSAVASLSAKLEAN